MKFRIIWRQEALERLAEEWTGMATAELKDSFRKSQ